MHRMEDGRIPKNLLYGELESGSRPVGRPKLRFKDVCKRDMLATGLPTGNWETHAADRGELPDFIPWEPGTSYRFCRTEVHFSLMMARRWRLTRKLGIGIVPVLCVRIITELKE